MKNTINVIMRDIDEIIPYENNPRNNDNAVEMVANSIREFGFQVPIVVDNSGVIIAGHTRLKAAKLLGLDQVPISVAEDLSEEQIRAFRIADNKVGEIATWDFDLLNFELENITGIDMSQFGIYDEEDEGRQNENNPYTSRVQIPVYEPTGEHVELQELMNTERYEQLVGEIKAHNLDKDVEQFLLMGAQRHIVFNFRKIAEYYANAGKEIQDLFEDQALVIIDYDKAIERGYVKLNRNIIDSLPVGDDDDG